uniref:Uncharacterized protein n=1 Tax=Rousettus aegyptiacus TaxID=9407 RepID=A0A7J8CIL6_ROUAE|nr:hypothetical protein HJG63_009184 [Rousettus aegyptiacus]
MGGGGLWGAARGPKGTAKRARVPPGCCAVPPAPSQAGQASGTARARPRIPSTHCGQTRTTYRPPAVCFLGGFPKIKGSQRFIPLLKTFFQVLGIPDMPRTVAWAPGAGGLHVTSSGGPAPAWESLAVTNLGPPQPP